MSDYLVRDVIGGLYKPTARPLLPAPAYNGWKLDDRRKIGLAVHSMHNHTSDEGWQLFQGVKANGYELCGHGIESMLRQDGYVTYYDGMTHVPTIFDVFSPGTVLVQDQREWDGLTADKKLPQEAKFRSVDYLRHRPDVFKVTILKDAHQNPGYHRQSADSMGCHAWVVYYHPEIVYRLAPYLRPQHIVRTYHTLDAELVPEYSPDGRFDKALLSGAVSTAYPLRQRLWSDLSDATCDKLKHPGYQSRKCYTPEFLKTLAKYKVAICTASRYGYALRKLIEATAAGCAVITDLPTDEVMPFIDSNLYRVHPSSSARFIEDIVRSLVYHYDPERQRLYAEAARLYYDYRHVTKKLVVDLDQLKSEYNSK